MSVPAPDLTQRYGAPSAGRRRVVVAGAVVLVVAALAWLAWVAVFHSRPVVTSQLVGFEVRGQHAAAASFEVARRDPSVRATCVLRAMSADHHTVGVLSVPVDSGPATGRVTSVVRTERRATTVELVGCSGGDQTRPR